MLLKIISYFAGLISRIKIPKFLRTKIFGLYISFYHVDVNDFKKPIEDFTSFQDFFTREVKNRKIDSSNIVSPVDGKIVDFGKIKDSINVKNFSYYIEAFLCNKKLSKTFENGYFLTIYLSPKDYHRIHSPIQGSITGWIGRAGRLKTVNPKKSNNYVLSTNERVVTLIDSSELGKLALIKVGALNVGSIYLNYLKLNLGNNLSSLILRNPYPQEISKVDINVEKGEEIARFNLGSTVVLCTEKDILNLDSLANNQSLKMGQAI